MSFLSALEVNSLGFASVGKNVRISKRASIYGAERISIGDHSRIDDFCVLSAGSGGIDIGSYVHVATMVTMIGQGRIVIGNYSGLSGRVSIYSSSDDYNGEFMTNPTVPAEFTRVEHQGVTVGKHVILGAGSVILPGAIVEDGVAVGALSLVRGVLLENSIYVGVPVRRLASRLTGIYEHEKRLNEKN